MWEEPEWLVLEIGQDTSAIATSLTSHKAVSEKTAHTDMLMMWC